MTFVDLSGDGAGVSPCSIVISWQGGTSADVAGIGTAPSHSTASAPSSIEKVRSIAMEAR